MKTRGGKLIDVLGKAIKSDRWSFVSARIELEGDSFGASIPFAEHVLARDDAKGSVPARLADEQIDAVWVRARIEALFGVASAPENERTEKTLTSFQLVAAPVPTGRVAPSHGVVFECTDYYGRAHLHFSDRIAPEEQAAIGGELWDLLLREPRELADYEDRAFHPGAGFWMEYGCREGEPFYSESHD